MISEMIHTASLVHDDVIDASSTRRGQLSVQGSWGQKKVYFLKLYSVMSQRGVTFSPEISHE